MEVRWRAPGRINLIGEHTDYNDGFALPFAIDKGCTASVRVRDDERFIVRSAQRSDSAEVRAGDLAPGVGEWAAYILGTPWLLRRRGYRVPGMTIEIDSDVPVGSGLSSSAAVVCSVTAAVADLLELNLTADELLAVTREVENDYVGAPTGGLDQLAALRAEAGHALLCDMCSLSTEAIPLPLEDADLTMLVVDTLAQHQHASGEYGRRREGCERAAARLGVRALRDIGIDELGAALRRLDDDGLRHLVRHVVTENDRVLRVAALLRSGNVRGIAPLLTASQDSMRDDYRVSADEVDLAVATLLDAGALGARMTGGGFGGCVIALLDPSRADAAADAVRGAFARSGYRDPNCFRVDRAAAGAHRLS